MTSAVHPRITLERLYFLSLSIACLMLVPVTSSIYGTIFGIAASYGVAIAGSCFWYLAQQKELPIHISSGLSALFLVILGPCGALIVSILLLTQAWFGDRSADAKWLLDVGSMDIENQTTQGEKLLQRLTSLQAQKEDGFFCHAPVVPMVDTIAFGTMHQKRRALTQIGRHYIPGFLDALKQSLRDPKNLVRVHAAAMITMVETQLLDDELLAEKNVKKNDHSRDDLLRLAQARVRRANSGLLDAPSLRKTRLQAIDGFYTLYLEKLLSAEDGIQFISLLFAERRYQEARPILRWLMQTVASSRPALYQHADFLRNEWLTKTKKWAQLRRLLSWKNRMRVTSAQQLDVA